MEQIFKVATKATMRQSDHYLAVMRQATILTDCQIVATVVASAQF